MCAFRCVCGVNTVLRQVYLNYVRRSVEGLSYDYMAYNILGFSCYTVFNAMFRWFPTVQREYGECVPVWVGEGGCLHVRECMCMYVIPPELRHGGHGNKIDMNDVVFAVHAVVLTGITLAQIALYHTPGQPPVRIPHHCFALLCVIACLALCVPAAVKACSVDKCHRMARPYPLCCHMRHQE